MRLSFVGDWSPSESLRGICTGLCIGNLECAFAHGEIASDRAYTSVLPIECVDIVRCSGFAALSLANNNVYDAGGRAFWNVRQRLKRESL